MSKAITSAQPASQEEIDYSSWFDPFIQPEQQEVDTEPTPELDTEPTPEMDTEQPKFSDYNISENGWNMGWLEAFLRFAKNRNLGINKSVEMVKLMSAEGKIDKNHSSVMIYIIKHNYNDEQLKLPRLKPRAKPTARKPQPKPQPEPTPEQQPKPQPEQQPEPTPEQQPDSFIPIKYCCWMQVRKDDSKNIHEIGWDKIDKYEFRNGFIEILDNPEYVHLYFDYDSIKTMDEFGDVIDWLGTLIPTFGKFSLGGYTNNKDMAEAFGLKYIEGEKHFISIHIVFCQTRIASKDLIEIMKHGKNGFIAEGVHPLCDPNVYKLETTQKFRHVLSDKLYSPGNTKNEYKAGTIMNNNEPWTQIVQTRGNEPIITKDEWSKHFHIPEAREAKQIIKEKQQQKKSQNLESDFKLVEGMNDLNCHDNLIMLSKDELLEILKEFPPEHDMLEKKINCLFQSPYDKEFIHDVISEWYFQREHTNITTVESYINTYYKKTDSNKWFYTLINHLPNEKKKIAVIEKYCDTGIDTEAKIDMDKKFGLPELRKGDYRYKGVVGVKVNKFISDLMRCVVVINTAKQIFVVKDYDEINNTNKLSFLKDEDFSKLMKSINLGTYYKDGKIKNVTAWMIYDEGRNKNWLMKDGMRFYDERPNIFSFFTGYEPGLLSSVDVSVIEPFLNHVKEVICNGNEELYEYILNWYSYIIQNPGKKTEIALVLTGKQGTGKNVFTNVLCDLMKKYSNRNLTNIDNIVGKFNASIENKMLIICNELSSAESNKYLNSDALKSVITENTVDINQKNMPVRTTENVCNLILVSNDFIPIKIEQGDRRYVVTEVSDKYKGNFDYFEQLCNSLYSKNFRNNLFTFCMKRDLSSFNPRRIPQTKTKEEILNLSKSAYQLFVEEYQDEFTTGWKCAECYLEYRSFALTNGFAVSSSVTFGKNIRDFCEHKKRRNKDIGNSEWIYLLKAGIKLNDTDE